MHYKYTPCIEFKFASWYYINYTCTFITTLSILPIHLNVVNMCLLVIIHKQLNNWQKKIDYKFKRNRSFINQDLENGKKIFIPLPLID